MSDFKLFCEINKAIDTKLISKLYSDVKCLLKCRDFIVKRMGWSFDIPIYQWSGVEIKDGRVAELYISFKKIGKEGAKGLVLPSGLKILKLDGNNISNEGAKELVLPPELQILYLEDNNIGYDGAKGLKLPPGLKKLFIRWNNIGNDGVKELVLSPQLQTLCLNENNIDDEGAKGLVLPPGLQNLYINHWSTSETKLIQYAKSVVVQWKERYAPIQRYYDFMKCKPIWKEICRGLMFGETEDSIFIFLQNIHGAKNIRYNILTFYNPFV